MKLVMSISISLFISLSLIGQNESELKPNSLIFSDLSDGFSGSIYGYNFFNIQSGSDVSSGAPGILSAGDDLQFSKIDKNGLTVTQSNVFDPRESSSLGLNRLTFSKEGSGANGNIWNMRTSPDANGDNALIIDEFIAFSGAAYFSEALYIKSTGFANNNNRIGIGTNNPIFKLDVEGTVEFSQQGLKRFYMPNWAPFGGQVIVGVFEGSANTAPVTRYQTPGGTMYADIGMDVNANLVFETADNIRMTIKQNGDVDIPGMLTKGGGTFKIDHPLDPENKFLYHSFMESPDMMNVYNGNIITDANGEATVKLPDYFETLNKDYRYQLTAVGTFSQLIVKEKLSNNSFIIASSVPNVEVSWQITGIRQDAYANKNRVHVEVDKDEADKGFYLHPEAFNQPKSKKLGATRLERIN